MPWCPVCKNEYIKGKTHCPDCDVDLVDELTEAPEPPEAPSVPDEEPADLAARAAAASHMNTHVPARERHSETRSSAWTFLIIGAAGFLVITLALAGVIILPLNTFSLAVLEGMFFLFLVVAGISFRNAMKMLDDISREDDLEDRIRTWAEEQLTTEALCAGIDEDTPEEMRYFLISEAIRERLMPAFPEVDDAYAEKLAEDFYNELFQETSDQSEHS